MKTLDAKERALVGVAAERHMRETAEQRFEHCIAEALALGNSARAVATAAGVPHEIVKRVAERLSLTVAEQTEHDDEDAALAREAVDELMAPRDRSGLRPPPLRRQGPPTAEETRRNWLSFTGYCVKEGQAGAGRVTIRRAHELGSTVEEIAVATGLAGSAVERIVRGDDAALRPSEPPGDPV